MNVLVIFIVLLLALSIVQFEKGEFFAVLTVVVLFVYFFICIYSLYKSFEEQPVAQHDRDFD